MTTILLEKSLNSGWKSLLKMIARKPVNRHLLLKRNHVLIISEMLEGQLEKPGIATQNRCEGTT